jgi:hypothetical protein
LARHGDTNIVSNKLATIASKAGAALVSSKAAAKFAF